MSIANTRITVRMAETGAFADAYFDRVPCVGEFVHVVDEGLTGRVVRVDWLFTESAALVDQQRATVWLAKDSG